MYACTVGVEESGKLKIILVEFDSKLIIAIVSTEIKLA
jgi:hypothetical protein